MKHLSISLGRLKLRIPLTDLAKLEATAPKQRKPKAMPAPVAPTVPADTRPTVYYNGGYNPDNIKPSARLKKPDIKTPEVLAPDYTPRYSTTRENLTTIIRSLEVGQEKLVPHSNPAMGVAEAAKVVCGMRYHAPDLRVHLRRESDGIRMMRVS